MSNLKIKNNAIEVIRVLLESITKIPIEFYLVLFQKKFTNQHPIFSIILIIIESFQ